MPSNTRLKARPVPKLFDIVELVIDRAPLNAGAVGTVVEEFPNGHVLVEFAGTDGSSPSVHAIALADLVLRP